MEKMTEPFGQLIFWEGKMADISARTEVMENEKPDATGAESAKRLQILDGAQRAFLANGYEGTSMSLIAREAGVSKGTLYVYFSNKEALFAAVTEEQCQTQGGTAFDALNEDGPASEILPAFGRHFVEFILTDSACSLRRLITAESAKFPELGHTFYELGPKRMKAQLAAYLKRRVEAGELDIPDTELAAAQFIILCKGEFDLLRQISVIDSATPQRIGYTVDAAVRLFLDGYSAER